MRMLTVKISSMVIAATVIAVDRSIFFGTSMGFSLVISSMLLAPPIIAIKREKAGMALGFFVGLYCCFIALSSMAPGIREESEAIVGLPAPSDVRAYTSFALVLLYLIVAGSSLARRGKS